MQTRTQAFPNKYFTAEDILKGESPVFLDIETTGFSPDVSAVFMIGCAYEMCIRDRLWRCRPEKKPQRNNLTDIWMQEYTDCMFLHFLIEAEGDILYGYL